MYVIALIVFLVGMIGFGIPYLIELFGHSNIGQQDIIDHSSTGAGWKDHD